MSNTDKKLRARVSKDWFALSACLAEYSKKPRTIHSVDLASLVNSALEASERVERDHRAFGKRFLRGVATPTYNLSVADSARYMVVKWVGDPSINVNATPVELMQLRTDVAYCYAVRGALLAAGIDYRNTETLSVDYAGDIANKV